jgi:hypothetical protein
MFFKLWVIENPVVRLGKELENADAVIFARSFVFVFKGFHEAFQDSGRADSG